MEHKNLNTKLMAALQAFDAIENIEVKDNWNETLMAKIAQAQVKPETQQFPVKFATMITCLVLINVGFVTSTIINNDNQDLARDKTLKIISKELLFSTNN